MGTDAYKISKQMPHGQIYYFWYYQVKNIQHWMFKFDDMHYMLPSDLFPLTEGAISDFGSEVQVVRYSTRGKLSTTTHILHSLLFVPSVETCSLRRMLSFAHLQVVPSMERTVLRIFCTAYFCSIGGNMFPSMERTVLRMFCTAYFLFHQ